MKPEFISSSSETFTFTISSDDVFTNFEWTFIIPGEILFRELWRAISAAVVIRKQNARFNFRVDVASFWICSRRFMYISVVFLRERDSQKLLNFFKLLL